jgi:hypothetical protein
MAAAAAMPALESRLACLPAARRTGLLAACSCFLEPRAPRGASSCSGQAQDSQQGCNRWHPPAPLYYSTHAWHRCLPSPPGCTVVSPRPPATLSRGEPRGRSWTPEDGSPSSGIHPESLAPAAGALAPESFSFQRSQASLSGASSAASFFHLTLRPHSPASAVCALDGQCAAAHS